MNPLWLFLILNNKGEKAPIVEHKPDLGDQILIGGAIIGTFALIAYTFLLDWTTRNSNKNNNDY